VLLVLPSTIPKTSSGKIQRSRLGDMIARDELDDHERAVELLGQAIDDDSFNFAAADELVEVSA